MDDEIRSRLREELSSLGALMKYQEFIDQQPAQRKFVDDLRFRLLRGAHAPAGEAGRRRASAPAAGPRIFTVDRSYSHRRLLLALLVLTVVATAVVAIVTSLRPARSPGMEFVPWPIPQAAARDLLREYPLSGRVQVPASGPPWSGVVRTTHSVAFSHKLIFPARLSATLPGGFPAAQLYGQSFDLHRIGQIARQLGIHSRIVNMPGSGGPWSVVRVRAPAGYEESVAVSRRTGELIYHGPAPQRSTTGTRLSSAQARSIARTWLSMLGWPGMSMPAERWQGIAPSGSRVVALSWAGIGQTNAPAAFVVLGSTGRVLAADIVPPIQRIRFVQARGVERGWALVRRAAVPVVVDTPGFAGGANLSASVDKVSAVHVLIQGSHGRMYLVPAYRFDGSIRQSRGKLPAHWHALAPAVA